MTKTRLIPITLLLLHITCFHLVSGSSSTQTSSTSNANIVPETLTTQPMGLLSTFSISKLLLTIFILVVINLIYNLVIKPYYSLAFYKKQGVAIKYRPFYGNMTDWVGDIKKRGDFLAQWKDYGQKDPRPKAVAQNFGSSIRLSILDTGLIKDFVMNNDLHIRDPIITRALSLLFGRAFSLSDGSVWKKQRKFFSGGFHFDFLQNKIPMIVATADEFLEGLKDKDMNNVALKDEIQLLLGTIIGKTFLGEEFGKYTLNGKPIVPFIANLVKKVGSLLTDPLYHLLGVPGIKLGLTEKYRSIISETKEFKTFFYPIVRNKFASLEKDSTSLENKPNPSMIELFHKQRVTSPLDAISDEEIIDQFISFHSGGLESTSGVTTMMTYYTLINPHYKERLLDEITKNFSDVSQLTLEKLNQMELLNAFVKEVLRMASPVITVMPRVATRDHQIGDLFVKKGTIMNVPFASNNFAYQYHKDPQKFDPERWLKGSESLDKTKADPHSFIPFGVGPRTCIGQHFAMIEVRIIFSLFLMKYNYELVDKDYKLVFTQTLAYEPETPVIYKITPRK